MQFCPKAIFPSLCLSLALTPVAARAVDRAEVVRTSPAEVAITWTDADPVTVLEADRPDAAPATARLVASDQRGGRLTVAAGTNERRYFILRDGGDGSMLRVAERVLPLEQGSNFRDVGGYVGAEGKRVKWGRIYRSGAMPLLTEADYARLGGLGLGSIVDLRSTDERQIAPDQLDDRTGALFVSNDYSMRTLLDRMRAGDGENSYRGMGKSLAPQYRAIFRRLLADEGAVLYHCSAGQDRTGIATALVLSALGVGRQTILADYHLSTALRRPQFEMPPLDPADWPGNPAVAMYAAVQKAPDGLKAQPLYSPKGVSHLVQFFEVIDSEYGSVEGYLQKELGIGAPEIAQLRALNLE
jgi:protein-tyrosine phosphatase